MDFLAGVLGVCIRKKQLLYKEKKINLKLIYIEENIFTTYIKLIHLCNVKVNGCDRLEINEVLLFSLSQLNKKN